MPLATEPLAVRQARYDRIHALRNSPGIHGRGMTMQEIADAEGISRQRVERILKRPRPVRQYGGRPKKAA
jgi:transposase